MSLEWDTFQSMHQLDAFIPGTNDTVRYIFLTCRTQKPLAWLILTSKSFQDIQFRLADLSLLKLLLAMTLSLLLLLLVMRKLEANQQKFNQVVIETLPRNYYLLKTVEVQKHFDFFSYVFFCDYVQNAKCFIEWCSDKKW